MIFGFEANRLSMYQSSVWASEMNIDRLQYCGDLMRGALMEDPVSTIFGVCVWILQVIGDFTGMGYELANVAIFVLIHPALTIALFVLWRGARRQASECSCAGPGGVPDTSLTGTVL